ncbi:hypothetical protein AVEN_57031-1 [Araneus ventricosus]|uniref:Uncharacterized protein n=1 Tax=Araneus ventricosus TaxID=182803 RepID=A0A4Y2C4L4_ARAVE|nr:hypothetical protein AVEN_57031-1 [Araneus ventricosus]
MSRFKATQGLFRDGLRNFEPLSVTRTTPALATTSPNFRATPTGEHLATTYDLSCNRPHTRRIFSGIGFRTYDPPVPTLPLGHHGLLECIEQIGFTLIHTEIIPRFSSDSDFAGSF